MNTPHSESSATSICPQCGFALPRARGYVTWCDQCEWNLIPNHAVEFPSFMDRINAKFGERYGAALFKRVMESASSLKPEFSSSRFLAYILAGLVHASTALLLIGGILLPVMGWPNFFALFAATICLSLAWLLRPRFGSGPENVLPREEYPTLYRLVQNIADGLGFAPVAGIAVDHRFNASFCRVGLRGRSYITIGLPLFAILTPDEQVALLGHEVAHGVNGDVQRSTYVGSAIRVLQSWEYFLKPRGLFSSESGLPWFFMAPVNFLLIGLAALPRFGQYLLLVLLFRDSQRAEYFADQLATKVAGNEGMRSMLEKLYFNEAYDLAVQRAALNKGVDLFEELRSQIAALPERELERLLRKARRGDSRVDATHPPTPWRLEFISRHGFGIDRRMLSEEEHKCLLQELALPFRAVQEKGVDEYKNRLYR